MMAAELGVAHGARRVDVCDWPWVGKRTSGTRSWHEQAKCGWVAQNSRMALIFIFIIFNFFFFLSCQSCSAAGASILCYAHRLE